MNYETIFNEILSLFFSHHSLEESIYIVATYLKKHIPFEKLTFYASDLTKAKHFPLIVFEESRINTSLSPHFLDNPPRNWADAHAIDKEISLFIENDLAPGFEAAYANIFDNRRSILAMTLEQSETYNISIALASPQPNQFTREHAHLLKMLRTPLAQLSNKFFKSSFSSPLLMSVESTSKLSSLELLKRCKGLRQVVRQLEGVATTNSMVLLQGETGVGKELFADALHMLSPRRDEPFVRVNCAAVTETLLDDAFFGHERGAYTGASSTRMGFFEQANNGTLFLDEIGELSPGAQAKLLRVLETQELTRIGGQRRILVNVRIVAATHRDLRAMVRERSFREDLWYRISIFPLHIPPLRQRREDIPALASWFYASAVKQLLRPPVPAMTEEYVTSLLHQSWPGNVRQLRHKVEQNILQANIAGHASMTPLPPPQDIQEEAREESGMPATAGTAAPPQAPEKPQTLDALNARHIALALEQCHGRIQGPFGAAALLGINASTLRSRMKKFGLSRK